MPFEIREIKAKSNGFAISFTKPVDRKLAADATLYQLKTFTHRYQQGYGSPEVDQTTPLSSQATVSEDGLEVELKVDNLVKGHVHEFHLPSLRSIDGEELVHADAYYTLNEIPRN